MPVELKLLVGPPHFDAIAALMNEEVLVHIIYKIP
jgi:hypothetical protein